MSHEPAPVVVLISGRGSNLQALIGECRAGTLPIVIRAVLCNNPHAEGLSIARQSGIPTVVVDHRDYTDRARYDRILMESIDRFEPRLVILAGFMRILGTEFIHHYAGRLLNIHPSLLPAFRGLNTHARALQAGVRTHGASVHFVTDDLDGGPVIIQAAVDVLPGDTPETLAQRVLQEEHRIYPLAIRWFIEGRLTLRNGRVLLDNGIRAEQGLVASPAETAG